MPSKPSTAGLFVPTVAALLAVTLASAAPYTANFIHMIRMDADALRWNYAAFFVYAAGMGLGAVRLPGKARAARGRGIFFYAGNWYILHTTQKNGNS